LVVDDDDEKGNSQSDRFRGINYPVALADSATRFAYGGVAALPPVFVINSEGRVVQKHVGLFNPLSMKRKCARCSAFPLRPRWRPFKTKGDIFLKHADRAKILPAST